MSVYDGEGPMALQVVKVDIPEPIAGDMPPQPKNRQQAMGRVAESGESGNACILKLRV